MKSHPVGTEIELLGVFKLPVVGTKVDPTEVHLQVRNPQGTVTYYRYTLGTVTRRSAGEFFANQVLNLPGDWFYRFTVTGASRGTTGDVLVKVDPSQFVPV
jgi:hypothetical protein